MTTSLRHAIVGGLTPGLTPLGLRGVVRGSGGGLNSTGGFVSEGEFAIEDCIAAKQSPPPCWSFRLTIGGACASVGGDSGG